jgi:large-conductance mechanosensitive channel
MYFLTLVLATLVAFAILGVAVWLWRKTLNSFQKPVEKKRKATTPRAAKPIDTEEQPK